MHILDCPAEIMCGIALYLPPTDYAEFRLTCHDVKNCLLFDKKERKRLLNDHSIIHYDGLRVWTGVTFYDREIYHGRSCVVIDDEGKLKLSAVSEWLNGEFISEIKVNHHEHGTRVHYREKDILTIYSSDFNDDLLIADMKCEGHFMEDGEQKHRITRSYSHGCVIETYNDNETRDVIYKYKNMEDVEDQLLIPFSIFNDNVREIFESIVWKTYRTSTTIYTNLVSKKYNAWISEQFGNIYKIIKYPVGSIEIVSYMSHVNGYNTILSIMLDKNVIVQLIGEKTYTSENMSYVIGQIDDKIVLCIDCYGEYMEYSYVKSQHFNWVR